MICHCHFVLLNNVLNKAQYKKTLTCQTQHIGKI